MGILNVAESLTGSKSKTAIIVLALFVGVFNVICIVSFNTPRALINYASDSPFVPETFNSFVNDCANWVEQPHVRGVIVLLGTIVLVVMTTLDTRARRVVGSMGPGWTVPRYGAVTAHFIIFVMLQVGVPWFVWAILVLEFIACCVLTLIGELNLEENSWIFKWGIPWAVGWWAGFIVAPIVVLPQLIRALFTGNET